MIQIAGKCRVCGHAKKEFISIVLTPTHTITMCMDCYAAAVEEIEGKQSGDIHTSSGA